MGYFAGRVKLIDSDGTAAIGVFVGRFALPCLLFTELASLSLSQIDMALLVAVTAAKVAMFVGVLGFSLTFDYHGGRGEAFRKLVGVSALRAIFCTQSNDFALGLPVIAALFKTSHPRLVSMLYLLSPISLLLLNPIGFLLMGFAYTDHAPNSTNGPEPLEASGEPPKAPRSVQTGDDEQKQAPDSDRFAARSRRNGTIVRTVMRVAKTPIVACSLAGVTWNLALGRGTVPGPLSYMLKMTGDAFTPCALFFTGLSLVGKVAKLTPSRLLLPATLTVCKVVVLAIVMYLAVGLAGGKNAARGFGFIYGAIPTAPSVLVYAHEYMASDPKVCDQIAVSLVLCTLAATPVLFVAGIIIKAGKDGSSGVESDARTAALYLSVPSAMLSSWLVASFTASWYQDRRSSAAALPTGRGLGWRPADTRVLLLVIIAVCHALGSSNSATCFSSTSHHSDGLAVGRLARYFVASVCRLAACGAAAAAALLPEPPRATDGPSVSSARGASCTEFLRRSWGRWSRRFARRRSRRNVLEGNVPREYVPLNNDENAQPSICMRNLNSCCENIFSSVDHSSNEATLPVPPPPLESATAHATRSEQQPRLATLFSPDGCEENPTPRTGQDVGRRNGRGQARGEGGELVAALLSERNRSLNDGIAPRERPRMRMLRALTWCLSTPVVVSVAIPLIAHASSQARQDPCGYVYGPSQFATTSAYLALCVVASLVGLKRTRRIVDVRYNLLRSASSSSLQRLTTSSPPRSPTAAGSVHSQYLNAVAGCENSSAQRPQRQIAFDGLPGCADTIGTNDDLAGLAALIVRENRAALRRGEQWTPPTPQDEAAAHCSTKLVTAIGHRMMLLIITHALYAFVACCFCLSQLAPKMATTKVRDYSLPCVLSCALRYSCSSKPRCRPPWASLSSSFSVCRRTSLWLWGCSESWHRVTE